MKNNFCYLQNSEILHDGKVYGLWINTSYTGHNPDPNLSRLKLKTKVDQNLPKYNERLKYQNIV